LVGVLKLIQLFRSSYAVFGVAILDIGFIGFQKRLDLPCQVVRALNFDAGTRWDLVT
jgi:hypothetical protein